MPDALLDPTDLFVHRHLGPGENDIQEMLQTLGFSTLEELADAVVPAAIRIERPLALGPPRGERELLAELAKIASRNQVFRSLLGMGYHDTITPPVILRNILENPGWYTQYTPYQAEIAQGRLEALLNFQTMVADLTGLPVANASLLDEATAAAEAMAMCFSVARGKRKRFVAAADCHPQTLAVLATRAHRQGIELEVTEPGSASLDEDVCGVLVQVPNTEGSLLARDGLVEAVHQAGGLVVMATDLLALTLVTPPGEMGVDIALGSSQRFGVPLGYGGPHAAFLAAAQGFERQIPGRIVGASRDDEGRVAYRLALQTREQHIRREKATSNICTAQVLLAVIAGMYAVYHGPRGLRRIAERVHGAAVVLDQGLRRLGCELLDAPFFDTLKVRPGRGSAASVLAAARDRRINLRDFGDGSLGIALDETVEREVLDTLFELFAGADPGFCAHDLEADADLHFPAPFARTSSYLEEPVFNRYHSEHEMLRYLKRLENRDISLAHSMIPLGSCTMKLNGTSEMLPITWEAFAHLHPFAPVEQAAGYRELFAQLATRLGEITGLPGVSLQPNSGAQGEYTGLLVIRAYHDARGDHHRDVCLIPTSAHGTNPASAVMAGMRVVPVASTARGDIDLDDLRAKAEAHRDELGALMITYPSTHGVFEAEIRQICDIVHQAGGQVYMDGANMNAQVGLCRPGDFGADVLHLNLHKTFCIPHGGGGPGMGPICAAPHLAPFLPGHPLVETGGEQAIGPVAAAPFGSPAILPISWVYIALMGSEGLKKASQVAILNANYMARRLADSYPVVYAGENGFVAHEFIVDLRRFRDLGVTVDDVAKRLMDFGFHAPTMSWPVAGTMMIEPTESESRAELDRFCDAMIAIREEIRAVEEGRIAAESSPLRHAPHTPEEVLAATWDRPYSREQGAFPAPWVRHNKVWPAVGRIDNAYGDRHLICTCPPVESFEKSEVAVTAET